MAAMGGKADTQQQPDSQEDEGSDVDDLVALCLGEEA